MQRQSLKLTARHRIGYLGHGAIEDGQYTVAGFDETNLAGFLNEYTTNEAQNIGLVGYCHVELNQKSLLTLMLSKILFRAVV